MKTDFPTITILGGGLLGGSLALALAALENPPSSGSGRAKRKRSRTRVTSASPVSPPTSNEAVVGADLVILAVPVGAMAALVTAALEAGLPDGCLITDVGSVKRVPASENRPAAARP